ncbi:MAG: NAD-dependent DNA ligase LigA [Patescibacteria group bacterium]
MEKDSRILKLEVLLRAAQEAYYNGTPVISDAHYDALADELRTLDPTNQMLTVIGASPPDGLPKVKHQIQMGSQSKVNTEQEFRLWAEKVRAKKFVVQEKLDGLSVELVYEGGDLVQAITRGDGAVGSNITHQAKLMQNIPHKLSTGYTGSLRGELLITKEEFKKHLSTEYKVARNAASGIAQRIDPSDNAKYLMCIIYDCTNAELKTEAEKLKFIQDLGFFAVPTHTVGVENAVEWYTHYQEEYRDQLSYEIDGLIIKVNDLEQQKDLGDLHGRPKGQIAWKFAAEMRETKLTRIAWDMGLTGRLTPVAILEPVIINGVEIRRASLHTWSNIKKLGLEHLNDVVLVSRRNDVIPQVESVVRHSNGKQIVIVDACPVCKADPAFEGEFLVCPNPDCPAKTSGDIKKWIKVLEIDEVGDWFITSALEAGLIRDPADIYTITREQVACLEGFGEASADIVVTQIQKHTDLNLAQFFAALNIPNASTSTFESLYKAGFTSVSSVLEATTLEMLDVPGIGKVTAEAIYRGVRSKANLIQKLLTVVTIKQPIEGCLSGKSFCFTGEISIKRPLAQQLVRDLGGEIKTGVSKGLNYLVQADSTSMSNKAQKARKYGTAVIGEEEFFELVNFSPVKSILKK